MEVEDGGKLQTFETQPKEGTLYLTAVRYSGGFWSGGPSGTDKTEIVRLLGGFSGVEAARIYSVKVPLSALPGA